MKLRWTQQARRDLLEIGRYIARDKPIAARRWVARLRQQAQQAADMPMAGRRVPEIGRDDVRETLLRSYRIVYLVCEKEIRVLTVFEGHKLMPQQIIDSLA
jgi:addiction module RelE/StbE family toxin